MSTSTANAPQETLEALTQAAANFSSIAGDLLSGYAALEEKARRIERELEATNHQLAGRLAEVDALHSDLAALLCALPCGVIVRGPQGAIVRSNPAAAALLGCRPEAVGDTWATLRETARADATGRLICRLPDGSLAMLSERCVRLPGERGGTLQILDDQTALAELEERMQSTTKMAALGTLAAGIAHEIRNPLNAVGGFGDLLRQRLDPSTKEHHWAQLIAQGVQETNRIITGLLHFARPGEIALEALRLDALIEELVASAREHPALTRGVTVEWDCPALSVRADGPKLRQAIRNLLENALDWTPAGGRVRISAWRNGIEALIAVEDSGPGIDTSLANRVFEPFLTTRPEGTGLGLALAHTVAELHHGSLTVDRNCSALGGARFLFRWLTTAEAPLEPAGASGTTLPATRSK